MSTTLANTRRPTPSLATLATATATELASFALHRRTMHPDCLLLQKHGVTSPRLTSSPSNNNNNNISIVNGSAAAAGSEEITRLIDIDNNKEMSSEALADKHERIAVDDDDVGEDDEEDEEDETEALEADEHEEEDQCTEMQDDNGDDDDIDAVSLCSDGSELSVGQEGATSGGSSSFCEVVSNRQQRHIAQSMQQTQRLLLSNVGDMMALCRSSAFSSVAANTSGVGGDGSDARSSASASTEDEPIVVPTAVTGVMDPFAVASALRIPVPLVAVGQPGQQQRTNTSPFQEEFLRKSHLYAEELMKQQMQFMAAARVSAFTTMRGAVAPGLAAVAEAGKQQSFRPQLVTPTQTKMVVGSAGDMPNFAGIHSHLSAISKMSQLGAAAAAAAAAAAVVGQPTTVSSASSEALAKLSALGIAQHQQQQQQQQPMQTQLTQASAISVSSLNQLQAQMQAHLPFMQQQHHHHQHHLHNNNNNNLNESALKFSIDNILKADFGRRITDPLLKRGGGTNCNTRGIKHASAQQQRHKKLHAAAAAGTVAMDLTSLMSTAAANASASAAGTLNFSNSLANICTNSNDSSSTAVSSNYGGGGGGGGAAVSDFLKTSPSSQNTSVSPAAATETGGNKEGKNGVSSSNSSSSSTTSGGGGGGGGTGASGSEPIVWPAWVYCTRYSDRPSSGPRTRKPKKSASEKAASPTAASTAVAEDKRPRTAFSGSQLARLKHEFQENRYLTEKRRQQLSSELGLNEAQIKIWFQNKRAKLKKSSGTKNPLALQLMAQGLYNHSTVPLTHEEEELQELQERENNFQNKRTELKKFSGTKNPLELQLMAQGLYNHSTVPLTREEEELQELQERENAAATAAAT